MAQSLIAPRYHYPQRSHTIQREATKKTDSYNPSGTV